MLNETHIPSRAYAARNIEDVTEDTFIPRYAAVDVIDYDRCNKIYFVEYEGKIFSAAAEELNP
jgi:hypothetical protein